METILSDTMRAVGTGTLRAVSTGVVAASLLVLTGSAAGRGNQRGLAACFILNEIGVAHVRRNPASSCSERVTPQSTFKIPHALAALDSGVIAENEVIAYDGHTVEWPSWRKEHALASALRYSVVWYFQEIARRLGADREREYLRRLEYGNQDSSGGLTTFWLGRSLAISPDEQVRFLLNLYADRVGVGEHAVETVRRLLIQPQGQVINASGAIPFAAPWPDGTVVSAKTGAGPNADGRAVRWLVGHVRRGTRAWIFVSNVVGPPDLPRTAAIDQAGRGLMDEHVLR